MLLCLTFGSCKGSNPPDVGPVEEGQAMVLPVPLPMTAVTV